jgi:hypothetical protein
VKEDHLGNTIMIIKVDMRTTGDLSSNKEETITTIDPMRSTPDLPGIIDLVLQDLTIKIMMVAMVVAKEAGTKAREVVSEVIVEEMAALEEASAVAIMLPEETPVALLETADLNSSSAPTTALGDLVLKTITIETK